MAYRARYVAAAALAICTLAGVGVLAKVSPDADAASSRPNVSRTITSKPIVLPQPTDPALGRLAPAANAASAGMFGPQEDWPMVPIHAALSRTGHIISYGTPLHSGTTQGGLLFDSWNPASGFGEVAHAGTDSMGYDSFCNSLVTMMDGRILMVGGNSSMSTMIYDPVTGEVASGKDLKKQRWYATALKLPSGDILVLGGAEYYNLHKVQGLPVGTTTGTTPEFGSGLGTWTALPKSASAEAFGTKGTRWFYPRAFNGQQDQVIGFSGNQLWMINKSGKVHLTGKLPFDPGPSGSQVMYAPGKVLVASGGSRGPTDHIAATRQAAIIDFTKAKPKVSKTGSMRWGRNWLNLTVLPNGQVLANGGTHVGTAAGDANSIRTAEVWNPATGKWKALASAQRTRTYHSTSLLLPSGAVFTGGSGAAPFTDGSDSGPENNMNAELYYPAYLFAKAADGSVRWAPRPKITSISGSLTYGGKVKLGVGASKIRSASLITLPSVTHSESTDQRRVPLNIKQKGRTVSLSIPKSVGVLPPGDYELTVTDAKGVPSPAQIVTIKLHGAGLVTLAKQKNPPATAEAPAMTSMPGMEH